MGNLVNASIIGYTPLNGHPYSFGCIINGFGTHVKIPEYEAITNYLLDNLEFASGIDEFSVNSVYCTDEQKSISISSAINAKSVHLKKLLDSGDDDLLLVLIDHDNERKLLIDQLLKTEKMIFVDKPLIKSYDELNEYMPYLIAGKLFSSSMLRFHPDFTGLKNNSTICHLNIAFNGNWENYFSHVLDPISFILDDIPKITGSTKNEIKIETSRMSFNLTINHKSLTPGFTYEFIFSNMSKKKIVIDSNFQSFRNGLIAVRNHVLAKKFFRPVNEYNITTKIYEAIKWM